MTRTDFDRSLAHVNTVFADPIDRGSMTATGPGMARAKAAGALIGRWFSRLVIVPYRRRKLFRELMTLDDRQLKDIGVCRSEIPRLARTAAEPAGAASAGRTAGTEKPGGKGVTAAKRSAANDTHRALAA